MAIELKRTRPIKNMSSDSKLKGLLSKELSFGKTLLPDKKKEIFFQDLELLLNSGIDIKTTLELIIEEKKKKKEKDILTSILESIEKGSTLSEALHTTKQFNNYEYYSLKIGEESGRLNLVLHDLVQYYNKKIKQKRQLSSASSYPILVMITAMGAVVFMLQFIIPMFEDVFARFGGKLPALTRMVIKISDAFSTYGVYIFLLIFSFCLILFVQRNKTWFRKTASLLLLNIPGINKIIQSIYLSRFCQSMALLIGSNTPMITSLDLVRKMISYYPLEVALSRISKEVIEGSPLFTGMKSFKIFDSRMITLIKVAEEVNQLESVFAKLYEMKNAEVEHKLSVLSNMLEPLLIVFVGIFVALILISMYLPMFQLSTTIY